MPWQIWLTQCSSQRKFIKFQRFLDFYQQYMTSALLLKSARSPCSISFFLANLILRNKKSSKPSFTCINRLKKIQRKRTSKKCSNSMSRKTSNHQKTKKISRKTSQTSNSISRSLLMNPKKKTTFTLHFWPEWLRSRNGAKLNFYSSKLSRYQ